LISLDEVHKFTKHEAPFGTAYGHHQWSHEGKKLADLISTLESQQSRPRASRLFITGIMICEIAMRSILLDYRRSRPLIRLDEVYKFTKYEAPFGIACGHNWWSREGKNLALLSYILESRRLRLGMSRYFITGIPRCDIAKSKLCLTLSHNQ
jgi:hypothetical protein